VVVDARLASGESGGVEGVVIGLAHGLSQLDGPEDYVFAVREGHEAWLEPYVTGAGRLVAQAPAAPPKPGRGSGRGRLARAASVVRATLRPSRPRAGAGSRPQRDGFVEALRPDIVHMPIQRGFLATAPSIYHPHDLQHVHLPQFFSDGQRAWRERWYGELCGRAAMVPVSSEWTRQDVAEHFHLPDGVVRVVPLAPPLAATRVPTPAERAAIRARLALPERYALYPAQTWPHKNHIRLLEALARLRNERGLVVPLVASGLQNSHFQEIAAASRGLGLEEQVVWTGFVPALDLQALFLDARAVVIPTLFEAASGPLWEAFAAGVPAACSNVTSLPEQAGDAAIVFDPLDPGAIADAVAAVWQDEDLRRRLVTRGHDRVASLSWERTARIFRAHYRRLAGAALSDEDQALVGS
jgi:glycosyltransferase involved in cell wall biosynthesis